MKNGSENIVPKSSETSVNKSFEDNTQANSRSEANPSKEYKLLVMIFQKFLQKNKSSYLENTDLNNKEFMELNQVKHALKYRDFRSVIQWCQENNVFINHQGNRKLVNRVEFLLSFHKPFLNHLKRIHTDWKERFIAFLNGDLKTLIQTEKELKQRESNYKPKQRAEVSFLNNIKNL